MGSANRRRARRGSGGKKWRLTVGNDDSGRFEEAIELGFRGYCDRFRHFRSSGNGPRISICLRSFDASKMAGRCRAQPRLTAAARRRHLHRNFSLITFQRLELQGFILALSASLQSSALLGQSLGSPLQVYKPHPSHVSKCFSPTKGRCRTSPPVVQGRQEPILFK